MNKLIKILAFTDKALKAIIFGCCLSIIVAACHNYYYVQHSGSIFNAGLTVPEVEHVQIDAVNAIDGCILKVKEKSEIEHAFEQASTNNYFGIIFTKSWLKSKTKIKPSQTNSVDKGV